MSPPPLNDDVLRHILSYLHGRDALHAALCSKRMRDLALPRVPVLAHVRSPDDLRRTCAYMLAGTPPRAHFLEDLLIDLEVFDYPKDEDEQAPLPASDYWDFSQAPLIGDLLAHAPRLRALELERLHPCLEADPRIGAALARMDRLSAATFTTVADGTFALMPRLPERLRSLRLVYFWEDDDPLEGETKTLPALVDALAPVRGLRELHLHHFQPRATRVGGRRRVFPAIRELQLRIASAHALALVALCPGLESLAFSLALHCPADRVRLESGRWPRLRALTLEGYREVRCVLECVGPVEKLCMAGVLTVGAPEEEADVRDLVAVLERSSPVGLRIHVASGSAPMRFWDRVGAAAPRLRGLEVVVSLADLSIESKHWLDIIPDALHALPLEYLSVEVLRTRTVPRMPHREAEEPLSIEQERQRRYAEAKALEEHRTRSIEELPRRLANAVPTLRVLSLAAAPPNEANLAGREGAGDPAHALFAENVGRMHGAVAQHWRIVREDGGLELRRLTAGEVDRMQEAVESARYEELRTF